MRRAAALALAGALALAACGTTDVEPQALPTDTTTGRSASANPDRCLTAPPEPGAAVFPDQAAPLVAERFQVTYAATYKVVTVTPPAPEPPRTYVLVQCGTSVPALEGPLAGAVAVEVPVGQVEAEGLAAATLDELGTPADGRGRPPLVHFGTGRLDDEPGPPPSPERILVEDWSAYERTPAGRAEWATFVGLFLNEELRTGELVARAIDDYEAVRDVVVEEEPTPPSVLRGAPQGRAWRPGDPGGWLARLVEDAGGRDLWWEDPRLIALVEDAAAVAAAAPGAEVWLADGTRDEVRAAAERLDVLAETPAWTEGDVWVPAGGGRVEDLAPLRPAQLLADVVRALHPELLEGAPELLVPLED